MRNEGSVWILGWGAFTARRLPVGLLGPLSGVTTVFSIIREPTAIWLPAELAGVEIVRLRDQFTNADDRIDNYRRVAGRVVDAAMGGGKVVYMTYGSPVVFDRIVGLIRGMCAEHKVPCKVIPTTSSVDALLAFIGEDMAPGLQVCEARWLVQKAIRLDPRLPVLLFQVGAYWTDGIAAPDDIATGHLAGLKEYLLRTFPRDHPAIFVRAPFTLVDEGYANCRSLEKLDQGDAQDLMDTSLYLPAVGDSGRDHKPWGALSRPSR